MEQKPQMHMQYQPLKLVLIGRGLAAKQCFAAIINAKHPEFRVVGVITDIVNPVNQVVCHDVDNLAKHLNLSAFSGDINLPDGIKWIDEIRPDIGIMFGYPRKLTQLIIDRFNRFVLNIHPSDLPKHRGAYPLHQQIIQNDPLVVTIHKIDTRFDAGSWIYKSSPIDISYLTREEVYGLMKQQAILGIVKVLENLSNLKLEFKDQNECLVSYATEATTGKLCTRINWQNDLDIICNIIRAAGTRSGISTTLVIRYEQKIETKIYSAYGIRQEHSHQPGEVLAYQNKSFKVAATHGFLIIDDLRNDQGKSLDLTNMLASNGNDLIFV